MNVLVAPPVWLIAKTSSPPAILEVPVPPTSSVVEACSGAPATSKPFVNVEEA